MLRLLLALTLCSTPLFAKDQLVAMSCGCPSRDYQVDGQADKRCLPAPLNGIVTSMKCCPGLWSVSAAALAVGGVAYALSDRPATGSMHLYFHN